MTTFRKIGDDFTLQIPNLMPLIQSLISYLDKELGTKDLGYVNEFIGKF